LSLALPVLQLVCKLPCRHQGPHMTLTDATIALLLAARIHGTDAAVRATAKRCIKRLPRSKRDLHHLVVESKSPLILVDFLAQGVEL
jgi:hypothetical protein